MLVRGNGVVGFMPRPRSFNREIAANNAVVDGAHDYAGFALWRITRRGAGGLARASDDPLGRGMGDTGLWGELANPA